MNDSEAVAYLKGAEKRIHAAARAGGPEHPGYNTVLSVWHFTRDGIPPHGFEGSEGLQDLVKLVQADYPAPPEAQAVLTPEQWAQLDAGYIERNDAQKDAIVVEKSATNPQENRVAGLYSTSFQVDEMPLMIGVLNDVLPADHPNKFTAADVAAVLMGAGMCESAGFDDATAGLKRAAQKLMALLRPISG